MGTLSLETDPEIETKPCLGCGGVTKTVRGFVYRDGDAYALYFAQMSPGHPDRGLALDIAISDWDEGAGDDYLRVGLWVRPTPDEISMSVAEYPGWPWKQSDATFGRLMDRDEALTSSSLSAYYEVADFVVA